MNISIEPALIGCCGAVLLLGMAWLAGRAMRAARAQRSSVSAVGWAVLFLTSLRMPPPPPASQIELEQQSEKDRGFSDPLRRPPRNQGVTP
jgi:hypothetical protein